MKLWISFLILLVLFSGASARAGLTLFEWTADTTLAPLILAVRDNETPEQAAERYLSSLEHNADLMELFAGHRPYMPNSKFKLLEDQDMDHRALLMANLPKDYTLNSLRVSNFRDMFARNKNRSLILPVAATLGLSLNEAQEFFQLISEHFPFLVAMGGDDVDPAQYGQEDLHSNNTIPTRDRLEIQLIKKYVQTGKGFLFAVCRGAQISSVALGYELNQHIPIHIGTDVAHGNDWHDVRVYSTANDILYSLTENGAPLWVNSFHHQSIRYDGQGPLSLAAKAPDGTIEALEFKNGRGLLLQFHPELMNNDLGEKIIARVVAEKDRYVVRSCSGIFQ